MTLTILAYLVQYGVVGSTRATWYTIPLIHAYAAAEYITHRRPPTKFSPEGRPIPCRFGFRSEDAGGPAKCPVCHGNLLSRFLSLYLFALGYSSHAQVAQGNRI